MADTEVSKVVDLKADENPFRDVDQIGVPTETVSGDFTTAREWAEWTRPSERLDLP